MQHFRTKCATVAVILCGLVLEITLVMPHPIVEAKRIDNKILACDTSTKGKSANCSDQELLNAINLTKVVIKSTNVIKDKTFAKYIETLKKHWELYCIYLGNFDLMKVGVLKDYWWEDRSGKFLRICADSVYSRFWDPVRPSFGYETLYDEFVKNFSQIEIKDISDDERGYLVQDLYRKYHEDWVELFISRFPSVSAIAHKLVSKIENLDAKIIDLDAKIIYLTDVYDSLQLPDPTGPSQTYPPYTSAPKSSTYNSVTTPTSPKTIDTRPKSSSSSKTASRLTNCQSYPKIPQGCYIRWSDGSTTWMYGTWGWSANGIDVDDRHYLKWVGGLVGIQDCNVVLYANGAWHEYCG
jgi:hypothetical protein